VPTGILEEDNNTSVTIKIIPNMIQNYGSFSAGKLSISMRDRNTLPFQLVLLLNVCVSLAVDLPSRPAMANWRPAA
jgi:hypothetical protein